MRIPMRAAVLVLAGTVLLLPACGGSSSPLWEEHERTYTSIEARDGFVRSDGMVFAVAGGPIVGDLDNATPGLGLRMLYSFDTSGISSNAEILEATLRVYQESLLGTPYTGHGDLVVDHTDIGPGLDAADWSGGFGANIGTLSNSLALEWKVVSVKDAVQSNVSNNRDYSDFRVRFETDSDNDGASDYSRVNDGADSRGTGHLPQLIVKYRTPRL